MNTQHQITPEELIEIPVGYDGETPVRPDPITFSEAVETLASMEHRSPMVVVDENGRLGTDVDLNCAAVFLRELEKAGYVIVKKEG